LNKKLFLHLHPMDLNNGLSYRNQSRNVSDLRVRAQFDVSTFDENKRTVEVVFATDNAVLTRNWRVSDEPFYEILSMDPQHIRKERIDSGLPILKDHYASIDDQIGIMTEVKFIGNQARGIVRFSSNDEVLPLINDIRDGIKKNVSVGYKVHRYMEIPRTEGQQYATYRAEDWEPMEVSFVAVPADPSASARSENAEDYPVSIDKILNPNKPKPMKRETIIALLKQRSIAFENNATDEQLTELLESSAQLPVPPAPTHAPSPDPVSAENARAEAARTERERITEIRSLASKAGLGEDFVNKHVNENSSIDVVRGAVIDQSFAGQPKVHGNVSVGRDREVEIRRTAGEAALVMRSAQVGDVAKHYNEDVRKEANKFRGMTLLDFAKDCLKRAGVNYEGMDKMEIAGRAITSSGSDFSVILEGTNRRILLANYENLALIWRQIAVTGSVGDFREYKRLRMGSFSDLESVGENGEFKTKKITDADFEKISVGTKGNLINVSRQMIVNDDLNAFARLAAMLGQAAARSIENDLFALLALNSGMGPNMVDGKALIHTDHGNKIGTGVAPTVASFEAMRILMAQQKDKDNNDYLNIRPSIGLFPMSIAGAARIVNGSQYDPDASNKLQRPNLVNGLLNNVVDTPRLSGTAYYMFADPNVEPVLEVAFLDGVQTPYMESQMGYEVDGMQWKIRLDYGVGAIGYRGVVYNPGA
jgi:hypothetical protein